MEPCEYLGPIYCRRIWRESGSKGDKGGKSNGRGWVAESWPSLTPRCIMKRLTRHRRRESGVRTPEGGHAGERGGKGGEKRRALMLGGRPSRSS